MTRLNFIESGKQKGASEADIQKACFAWLMIKRVSAGKSLMDYTYMVPNGTQLSGSLRSRAKYMASLKAQGFRTGVSDLVIAYPTYRPGYHGQGGGADEWGHFGAYIELKREPEAYGGAKARMSRKNAIRLEQRDWLMTMSEVGYFASVAWGFEDFKQLVGLFLAGENPPPLDWDDRVCDTVDAQ